MLDVIDIKNIDFIRDNRAILGGVNWRVERGQHWAIVGANGSGKTTLLRLATGYLWPSAGEINVLGKRYGEVDLAQLRRRIGWVSSALAEMIRRSQTALEIVLTGAFASTGLFAKPSAQNLERATSLLNHFGCAAIAATRFGVLSLGEQQRVLIARALMAEPELLILDEACAGLDLPTREAVLAEIDALARAAGRTLVFVTHHIEVITSSFSHVLVLRAGQVAAAGKKEDVLTGEVLSAAMGVAVHIDRHEGRYWPRVG
jgi:iron complex transport system ATP-binding protein